MMHLIPFDGKGLNSFESFDMNFLCAKHGKNKAQAGSDFGEVSTNQINYPIKDTKDNMKLRRFYIMKNGIKHTINFPEKKFARIY